MSGMDPGRPKIEDRRVDHIWVGTRILTEDGVQWTVEGFEPHDGTVTLNLIRWKTDRERGRVSVRWSPTFPDEHTLRCRVEKEDR